MLSNGKVNVIVDGQAGSCGKGKIAAFCALTGKVDVAVSNFGPNAGHTVRLDDGTKLVFRHLPAAAVNHKAELYMGAGSLISPATFLNEIEELNAAGLGIGRRLKIHPRAMIIEPGDVALDGAAVRYIASTGKGTGPALSRKILRSSDVRLAADHAEIQPWVHRDEDYLHRMVSAGATVLAETSQGFDLDINHGLEYPHCTSRQVSPMQTMADLGLPCKMLGAVIGVVRPFPIRVGDYGSASSGGYAGSKLLAWEGVFADAGVPEDEIPALFEAELTTVTKRLRKVFEFNHSRYARFVRVCAPTHIVLNHADYLDWTVHGQRNLGSFELVLPDRVEALLHDMDGAGPRVTHIGTGPRTYDIWRR